MKLFLSCLCILLGVAATGQPYWQQEVNTTIAVTLDDRANTLRGFESIEYVNNSPDTLRTIYIHLWANAFKNDHTPFAKQFELNGNTSFYFAQPKERGYIDSLDVIVDGQSAELNISPNMPDVGRIDLIKPLLPGKRIRISTPFFVKIPEVFSRLGHTGQAYFISQWFPKPAVYDRKGWHPMSNIDQGEYYSEFGSYDVSITLPSNYVVMATGNLSGDRENKWLDSLSRLPLSAAPLTDDNIKSALDNKTVHFHEEHVHDFAWFADKRWIIRKDSVVSAITGKTISTWLAYLPSSAEQWAGQMELLKKTLQHYEKWVGPYAYSTIKVVLGDLRAGGGMEYPTIALVDQSAQVDLETVIVHEVGHNWFYGMVGTNERDNAWMDEGINTFYEKKTRQALNPDSNNIIAKVGRLNEDLFYYQLASTGNDQTINQTSARFSKLNYPIDVYYKTSIMLKWLEQYMGPSDFEDGMKQYFATWSLKHPYPEDFRASMQSKSQKSLDWFFDGVFYTANKIDFKIKKATVAGNNTEVRVVNRSNLNAPVKIQAFNGDSMVYEQWVPPFQRNATVTIPISNWTKLKIDSLAPDAKTANDVYRRRTMFPRFGLKLKFLAGTNVSEKDRLFIAPALGYNQYDGLMAGILLHNLTLPENNFRFALAPLYGFNSAGLCGAGSVGYMFNTQGFFKDILVQGDLKSFSQNYTSFDNQEPEYAQFTKAALQFNFHLREGDQLSTRNRNFQLRLYQINEETLIADSVVRTIGKAATNNQYALLRYTNENRRTYNPYGYRLEAQYGKDFAKLGVEGNVRVDYNKPGKALHVRAFLGKFFSFSGDAATERRYQLNASYSGVNDYLFDGTYFGRNDNGTFAGQQISIQEGGFKIPVNNGVYRSDNWLASINLATDLPLRRLPIRLFFDAGLTPNFKPTPTNNKSTTFFYDGGLEVYVLKDVISLYVPIMMSGDFRDYLKNAYGADKAFGHTISFTMHLQNFNWLQSPTQYLKRAVN